MMTTRILFVLVSGSLLVAPASALTIGGDDFDGGGVYTSRLIVPDNSGNNGAFAGSSFDVFGITDRTVNTDFADDSAGSFPADTFGVLKTAKTDHVFGVEDLANSDNSLGTGTATWTFDITGYTDIAVSIDFAAMGNFDLSNDSLVFTAAIDGGAAETIFEFVVREDLFHTYVLESGTTSDEEDPLELQGIIVDNDFQTFMADVTGTGSELTLTFEAASDGSNEVFVFDNLLVTGVPEPISLAFFAIGGVPFVLHRRFRRR